MLEIRPESSEERVAPLVLRYYADCLKRLLPHLVSGSFVDAPAAFRPIDPSLKMSDIDGTLLLAGIFVKLSPLFTNSYAVTGAFVPLLFELSATSRSSMTKLIDVINELCDSDECEQLWRACVGYFGDSSLCASWSTVASPLESPSERQAIGLASREICIVLLCNRRVLRHVYRWSRCVALWVICT